MQIGFFNLSIQLLPIHLCYAFVLPYAWTISEPYSLKKSGVRCFIIRKITHCAGHISTNLRPHQLHVNCQNNNYLLYWMLTSIASSYCTIVILQDVQWNNVEFDRWTKTLDDKIKQCRSCLLSFWSSSYSQNNW